MIRSAQELLNWLERCPKGRSIALRYINTNPAPADTVTIEYIKSDLLREIADIASEDLLFIPIAGGLMPGGMYMEHVDVPASPMSNAMITGLEAPGATEPIKRLANPLRDPKLDWLRSKGK